MKKISVVMSQSKNAPMESGDRVVVRQTIYRVGTVSYTSIGEIDVAFDDGTKSKGVKNSAASPVSSDTPKTKKVMDDREGPEFIRKNS